MSRRARLHWIAVLALAVLLCMPAHAADFVPERVFAGASHGEGHLKLPLRPRRPFTVQSSGVVQPDGSLRLDQTIHMDDEPARSRTWRMRRTGPDTYAATLSDAAGPVTARVTGSQLRLRYPLRRWAW